MALLVVGTMAFDSISTPYGHVERVIGGAATYISLSASYLVSPVQVVSVVGDDFPEETMADLRRRGVDLSGVQIKEGQPSFFWAGKYHADLNTRDTLVTDLNVLADFDPAVPASFRTAEYVLLGNLTPTVQLRVLEQLEKKPALIAMDTMNFWMDQMPGELREVISKVDLLTINDEEARQLSGEYSLVRAAHHILNMGPNILVIKKGEHGALLFMRDRDDQEVHIFYAPALPLMDVYDPTGAGDSFAGGMMGYLAWSGDLSFENLKRSILYGSAMASFCVERFSVEQLLHLSPDQIVDRIGQFRQLVSV